MKLMNTSFTVILSEVHCDEGAMNGVEGSRVVSQRGECPEILRLRNPTLRVVLLRSG
jgi:hypothetical protein